MNRKILTTIISFGAVAAVYLFSISKDHGANSPATEDNQQSTAIETGLDSSTTSSVENSDFPPHQELLSNESERLDRQSATNENRDQMQTDGERRDEVRLFITQLRPTDTNANMLRDYVASKTDDGDWSDPVRETVSAVLERYMPGQIQSGEAYTECGGYMCIVVGLTERPKSEVFHSINLELNKLSVDVAGSHAWPTEKYGWILFIASPKFVIPN